MVILPVESDVFYPFMGPIVGCCRRIPDSGDRIKACGSSWLRRVPISTLAFGVARLESPGAGPRASGRVTPATRRRRASRSPARQIFKLVASETNLLGVIDADRKNAARDVVCGRRGP